MMMQQKWEVTDVENTSTKFQGDSFEQKEKIKSSDQFHGNQYSPKKVNGRNSSSYPLPPWKFQRNHDYNQNVNGPRYTQGRNSYPGGMKRKRNSDTNGFNKNDGRLRRVCVENVPIGSTFEKIKVIFERYGILEKIVLFYTDNLYHKKKENVSSEGNISNEEVKTHFKAHVWYHDRESADKALAASKTLLQEHELHVIIEAIEDRVGLQGEKSDKNKIYVGNVHFNATQFDLRETFKPCGELVRVIIPRNLRNPKQGRGYAFITFKDSNAVDRAFDLNGTFILNRRITVTKLDDTKYACPVNTSDGNLNNVQFDDKGSIVLDNNSEDKLQQAISPSKQDMNDSSGEETEHEKDSGDSVNNSSISPSKQDMNDSSGEETEHEKDSGDSVNNSSLSLLKSIEFAKQKQQNEEGEENNLKEKKISSKSQPSMKKKKSKLPALKIKSAAKKMKLKPLAGNKF